MIYWVWNVGKKCWPYLRNSKTAINYFFYKSFAHNLPTFFTGKIWLNLGICFQTLAFSILKMSPHFSHIPASKYVDTGPGSLINKVGRWCHLLLNKKWNRFPPFLSNEPGTGVGFTNPSNLYSNSGDVIFFLMVRGVKWRHSIKLLGICANKKNCRNNTNQINLVKQLFWPILSNN
jgi:hypothetical protein